MDWNKDKVLAMADSRKIGYSGSTLCGNYRRPLEKCDTAAQAIRLFKNCVSWALLERYPSKADMLSFAEKEVWADNGVFIDKEFAGERIDGHICCVFIGCGGRISTGLNVDKAIIPMLYLSEGSDLEITVDRGLLHPVPVEMYYGSKVRGDLSLMSVKDCNRLTPADNSGFTDEELNTDPDIYNSEL